jgi:hypothetical protein
VTSFVSSPHAVRGIRVRQRSSFLSTAIEQARRSRGMQSRGNVRINSMHMKDASSSYWFSAGDYVEVISHVTKSGIDLKGRRGRVVETWEKCDVDPTCCCAEFVDDNFAVLVKFQGSIDLNPEDENGEDMLDSFTHHFHEDELRKVEKDLGTDVVPFDGMSCMAFKLNQLKMGQQSQRVTEYENATLEQSSQPQSPPLSTE